MQIDQELNPKGYLSTPISTQEDEKISVGFCLVLALAAKNVGDLMRLNVKKLNST
jgi:hypothetical protein